MKPTFAMLEICNNVPERCLSTPGSEPVGWNWLAKPSDGD
jgi:hypothetical protein